MIRPVSKKRQDLNKIYSQIAKDFKRGKCCAVCGGFPDDIHHAKSKWGYADNHAKLNDIPLMVDERFFLPVCRSCHRRIEDNPEWAREQGYSLSRLEKKEYPEDFKMY